MRNKKFHEIARHTEEPPFVKLVFIQLFLAMALAEHTGVYNGNIAHIVGNALSDIAEDGKHYDHLKQNSDLIVDMIQQQLEKLGYRYDREKLRETIRTAVERQERSLTSYMINIRRTNLRRSAQHSRRTIHSQFSSKQALT
ncbi:hypothetical protein [Thermococcus sp.]